MSKLAHSNEDTMNRIEDNSRREDGETARFYRKKPVVIEAVQFDGSGDSCDEVDRFLGAATPKQWKTRTNDGGYIITLEGDMEFRPGDWIIKGVKGEFYPCKPDIFTATYEPA